MRYLSGFTLLAVLGTAMTLLPRDSKSEQLEGTWEVTSVQRDGKPDLSQVGSRLTFMDNRVTFWPTVLESKDVIVIKDWSELKEVLKIKDWSELKEVFEAHWTGVGYVNLSESDQPTFIPNALEGAQTLFQPSNRQVVNQFS